MSSLHTIELRLYPNRTQKKQMMLNLECCRYVYNQMLEFCTKEWKDKGKSYSHFDLCHVLTEMKKEHIELNEAYSQCLIEAVDRLGKAFKAFFRRVKNGEEPGYPRFKGKDRYKSFSYIHRNQFSLVDGNKLRLGKIGDVEWHGHLDRFLLESGTMKKCTVKMSPTGKWFAYIVVESEDLRRCTETFKPKKDVGVDLNIKNLATLSDGTVFPNEKRFEKEERSIAKKQRQLSICEKGTPERARCKLHLAHKYERLNFKRKDDAHRISRHLVDNYGMIVFEDLNIQNMISDTNISSIHKAYYSVAWDRIVRYTGYKAEDAGIPMLTVNPAYTSQLCSKCGNIVPKTLDERTHHCDVCNLTIDRDLNATMNILKRGRGRRPLSSEG